MKDFGIGPKGDAFLSSVNIQACSSLAMKHVIWKSGTYSFLILVILFILSGCTFGRLLTTPFEKPVFTYVGSELVSATPSQALVNFHFSAYNPNPAGLKNAVVSFELSVQGKRFSTGTDVPFELIANGETVITIPAVIIYRDLFPVLGSVVERLISGGNTIPLTISTVFSGKPAIFVEEHQETKIAFEMNIIKTIEIPLTWSRQNK